MSCKPTYKGKRYNSLEELYNANGVNTQQAQQLYSQYLNTIFPDSKVKDIVYRGDGSTLNKAINSTFGTGYYFTPKKSYAENFAEIAASKDKGYGLYISLINLVNPLIYNETVKNYKVERSRIGKAKDKYKEYALNKLKNNENIPFLSDLINNENTNPLYTYKDGKYFTSRSKEVSIEEIKQNIDLQVAKSIDDNVSVTTEKSDLENINEQLNKNNDGIIINIQEKYNDIKNEYIVFEPEQIHILGSKQDIEGFKSWVDSNQTNVQYQKEIDLQVEQDAVLEEFANSLSERFNISFNLISEREAKSMFPKYINEPAFFDPKTKKAYLVKGKANKTSAIHEIFTHPFLLQIENTNPTLYKNLLKEAKNNKSVADYVDNLYGTNQNNAHEYIARAIDLAVQGELDQQKDKTLLERIQDFFNQLSDYLKKLFNIPKVFSSAISPSITLQQLTQFAMYGKGKMNLNPAQENIEYSLKATNVIVKNLDKIKQWEKNKSISEDVLWNKIQGLGVPKEQLELIKNSEGNTVEEKLLDFVNQYGYTIEINTATIKEGSPHARNENEYPEFEYNGNYFARQGGYFIKATSSTFNDSEIIFTDEYFEALEKSGITATPSKYYSNLTVPGGTNYTENEIATPLITPSIKGHAQFSTDNGIGWFRSDDKAIGGSVQKSQGRILEEDYDDEGRPIFDFSVQEQTIGGVSTKTRRILEVQSDLFQRGRNKNNLLKSPELLKAGDSFTLDDETYTVKNIIVEGFYEDGVSKGIYILERLSDSKTTKIDERTFIKRFEERTLNKPGNQFLQLLNKDSNWVTFFVKSIIQDSAKKGYEKVLFPTGNTASKVEGHSTLEEFKKGKENRINSLIATNEKIDKGTFNASLISSDPNYTKELYERNINEINQLKQELERVEREGFGALKPIYNFYENIVANILKKQGYNSVEITDEYGNTWNEVTIDENRDNQNIVFQREYQSDFFKGLDPYQQEAKEILYDFYKENITNPNDSRIGFYNEQLRKLSESVGDEQWYLRLSKNNKWYVAGYKNGSVTHPDYFSIYAEQRYTAWNRSRYYEEFNRKHSIGAAKNKIRSVIYSNKVNALLDNIQQSFPGLPIIRETKETTKAKGHKSTLPGWMDADGYHINMDNIHPGVFVHEIAHMFRAILKTVNPTAYKELERKLDDYISENPNWYEAYLRKHPNQSDDVTRDEILAIIAGSVSEDKIAHFLSDNDVEPTNTEIKTFRQRVKEIFDAIWSAVRDFFGSHYGTTAFDGDLSNMTLEELFMGITDDIIAGREIRHISPKDMEIISYEYQESGRTFQESPKNNLDGKVNVIENVGDIPNIIINNPNRNVITDSNNDAANNPELFVNAVFMRRQTLLNNTGNITWLGKRFDYENLTDDQIKTLIRTEILPYHLNVQERFIDDIRSVIELVQEGNEISYAITKTFIEDSNEEYEDKKRSYIKVNELQKLLTLIGTMDNIKDVLSLSEFMSKYSNLGLVDPRMVGLDPLVIVHENSDKSISISISDITAADLSSQGKFTGSRNKLNGRFVNNVSNMFDMDSSKITWSNNKRDARAAALTFTLASMNAMAKKNNIHLDIRRAGVFSMQGGVAGHIYSRTIHDYQDAFDQVKELFTIPEMRGLVSDNATSIIETLNNDQAWDAKDLYCDHIFELRSYYNSQATINNIPDWYRDDLLGINMSKKKHIEVLRARQKQIETQRASIRATAETDYEYQAIAKAIYWYNQGVHVNNMSIDDISSGLMKRIINPHNLGNGIVDYATIQFEAAKSMVVNKANLFTDELSKHIKASMKSHGKELIMENIISMNPANEIFDRLFPKIEAIVDKPYEIRGKKYNTGDKVTVSLSNEIYCSAHPNIKKALGMKDAKGNALLTKEDVALADFIVKTVREQYVEALLNRNRYNKKYTIEDAIEELDEVYLPYTLPVIRATQEQNIRAGAIKTFFGRFLDKMVNQGINWGDLTSTEFSEINDRFFHQRSYTKQLEAMGLELVNGEYRVNNLESLFNISNNLEYTMKIFVMDSERKRIYDDHVTPILNDCFAIANYADKSLNKPQDNTKEFLREYYNLIALHKRKDDYMPQGIVKSTAPVVRTALQLHTFISIAYRPLIWIKSAYFNESAQWLYGIANSAANWGITTGEKLNMPGANHMAKAHKLLFGSKADYKKIWKLANKMQLINGNQRDVLENVFSNIADKHLFKQQLAHLGNWYTDAAARALTMVTYMLFDGSYDAHIYNPKTGELTYDVTKDERFYKNGKKIEGWDLVHDRIVEKQTTQGLITDGKQQMGYDFEEINKRIKWYADKFIIGSMDIHQKALLGNQFAGAAVGQFRGFSIDKIWNDIAIGKIKSTYGGRLVPYKDENGEWVTVEEQIEMESNLQSVIGYLWDFRKLTKGINNWKEDSSWNNLSPIRRRNLMNVTVRLVVMGAIIMAIKALRMSDRDRRKVEWMFSELFMYDTMENIFDNPVPVISSIEDMYKIILGKKRFAKIYRYMGPVNDAVWFYELASSNDEVAKHEKTERQKAKEKKEREEKKELEKLKKQKALEKYGFIPDEYK